MAGSSSKSQDTTPPVPMEAMTDAFVKMWADHHGMPREAALEALRSARAPKPSDETGDRPMSIGEFLEKPEPDTVFYMLREAKNDATSDTSRDFGYGMRLYENDPGMGRRMVRDKAISKPKEYEGPGAMLSPHPVFRIDLAESDGIAITEADVAVYPHAKTNHFAEIKQYFTLRDLVKMLRDDPDSWLNAGLTSGEIIEASEFAARVGEVYQHWLLDIEIWKKKGSVGPKPPMRQWTLAEIGMNLGMLDAPTNVRTAGLILRNAKGETGEIEAMGTGR